MRVWLGQDPIRFPEGRRHWICSICSHTARWSDTWASYGSLGLEDAGEVCFVTCSDDCRNSKRAKQLTVMARQIRPPKWNGQRSHAQWELISRLREQLGLEDAE